MMYSKMYVHSESLLRKKSDFFHLNHYPFLQMHIAGSSPASPPPKPTSPSEQDWFQFTHTPASIDTEDCPHPDGGLWSWSWPCLTSLIHFLNMSMSLWIAACPSGMSTIPLSMAQKSLCFLKLGLFLKVRHTRSIIEKSLVFPKTDFEIIGF